MAQIWAKHLSVALTALMGDMAVRIRKVLATCNVTLSFATAPSNDFTTFVNHHSIEAHPQV